MIDMSNRKEENRSLSIYDFFMAVFYIIIVTVGVDLCLSRGIGATKAHLIALTVSVFGVLFLKLAKYRGKVKSNLSDIIFVAVLCVLSVFALVTVGF
jgi:hypothetical protein